MMELVMEIRKLSDIHKYRNYKGQVDLHGLAIQQGYQVFNRSIESAYFNRQKKITIITGQGMMMRELPTWCYNNAYVRDFTPHKHNPGSFTIKLKKGVDK